MAIETVDTRLRARRDVEPAGLAALLRRLDWLLLVAMLAPENANAATNVTLATLKAGDTAETLMQRVKDSRAVAAE